MNNQVTIYENQYRSLLLNRVELLTEYNKLVKSIPSIQDSEYDNYVFRKIALENLMEESKPKNLLFD